MNTKGQPRVDTTIYLDVSRLLTAGYRRTPTGIERVELAYTEAFGRDKQTRFVGFFLGRLHIFPRYLALSYLQTLEGAWKTGSHLNNTKAIVKMVLIYIVLLILAVRAILPRKLASVGANSIYINMSHQNLDARRAIVDFKRYTGAKLLFFVHDLIPILYPEYVRPGQAKLHRRRMDTVGALADAVLVNSASTEAEFFAYLKDKSSVPSVHIVKLGVAFRAEERLENYHDTGPAPYFLFLATIEPRKNHLLLLNLWRQLIADMPSVPRLIIIGRRGWENEMVLDMLERCVSLSGIVEERGNAGDDVLAALMKGARALLLPSFAEGYGLPVAEALAVGIPVICSDLPALREIGGDVPEYIDPLDGAGWRRVILDYAQPNSPRRAAQCERLLSWSAPRWEDHFHQVRTIIDRLIC